MIYFCSVDTGECFSMASPSQVLHSCVWRNLRNAPQGSEGLGWFPRWPFLPTVLPQQNQNSVMFFFLQDAPNNYCREAPRNQDECRNEPCRQDLSLNSWRDCSDDCYLVPSRTAVSPSPWRPWCLGGALRCFQCWSSWAHSPPPAADRCLKGWKGMHTPPSRPSGPCSCRAPSAVSDCAGCSRSATCSQPA